jgi:hypothetical protein
MESFLRDYGALVAPTAAIINGFIAVVIAQFYRDHPIAKVVLVIAAGLLGAVAIGATMYSQRLVIADREFASEKRKAIREKLGAFIEEGNALKERCTTSPPIWDQANEWAARVEKYLDAELGHAYVIRDRDGSGALPLSFSSNSDLQNLCYSLHVRIIRLGEFFQQFPL